MADNFVQNIVDKLFNRGDSKNQAQALDGPLERSESFKGALGAWQKSERAEEILHKLSNVFWNVYRNIGNSPALYIYSSPQANGFYFNTKLGISDSDFNYLMDSFRDRVLDMGYAIYTSDTKYAEVPAGIQRIDKHYLKPLNQARAGDLADQKFGNVLFELYSLNEEAQYLKCMVTVYADRKFVKALSFEHFAEALLKSD